MTRFEQLSLTFQISTSDYTDAELALLTPDDIWQRADEILLSRLSEDPRLEKKQSIHGKDLGNTTLCGLIPLPTVV